jgi:hypothetical protein
MCVYIDMYTTFVSCPTTQCPIPPLRHLPPNMWGWGLGGYRGGGGSRIMFDMYYNIYVYYIYTKSVQARGGGAWFCTMDETRHLSLLLCSTHLVNMWYMINIWIIMQACYSAQDESYGAS